MTTTTSPVAHYFFVETFITSKHISEVMSRIIRVISCSIVEWLVDYFRKLCFSRRPTKILDDLGDQFTSPFLEIILSTNRVRNKFNVFSRTV